MIQMEIDRSLLQQTLDISKKVSTTMHGHNDPQHKRISHNNHHITLYIKDYIMKEDCKTYLEIGSHYGHSLSNILHSQYPSKYMAVDIFKPWADGKIADMKGCVEKNAAMFNSNNHEVNVYQGSSHDQSTLSAVKDYFPEGIDMLFIDGDHSYKGIATDFDLYFPLVNPGGYIIFDDYLPLANREAPKAIDDIRNKYKNEINDIGLIDDVVEVWKLKEAAPYRDVDGNTKNIDYIVQKK